MPAYKTCAIILNWYLWSKNVINSKQSWYDLLFNSIIFSSVQCLETIMNYKIWVITGVKKKKKEDAFKRGLFKSGTDLWLTRQEYCTLRRGKSIVHSDDRPTPRLGKIELGLVFRVRTNPWYFYSLLGLTICYTKIAKKRNWFEKNIVSKPQSIRKGHVTWKICVELLPNLWLCINEFKEWNTLNNVTTLL